MSDTFVEVVQVNEVRQHPNADRLEIAVVNGATVVVGKEAFKPGELAAYFPPNMLIPDELADSLGVTKYLKHAVWQLIESWCNGAGIETVPLLYSGPFSQSLIDDHTHGPTTLGTPRSSFKGREGIVITPLAEMYSEHLCGRLILKSVSADYLDRKGAEDNE